MQAPPSRSRINRYLAAVSSGYLSIGVNVVFTILSLRLASDHLNQESFGTWMVATEAANFFSLFELGISNALLQQFVQHIGEKNGRNYREVVGTAWVLFGAVSLALVVGVLACLFVLPAVLGLSPSRVSEFQFVLAGLGAAWVLVLLTKPLALALQANHCVSILNFGSMISFGVNLTAAGAMLIGGGGIKALVAGNLAGAAASVLWIAGSCYRLALLPAPGSWILPQWASLMEPIRFSANVFLINIGMNLVFFSRTIAVTAALGLADGGTWGAMQRPFTMAYQLCWKPLEMGFSHLVELHVSGQRERFRERYKTLFRLTLGLSVCAAFLLAACNRAFVEVWHSGRFVWPWYCDVLLGALLIPLTIARCGSWLAQSRRAPGRLPVVSIVEGVMSAVGGYVGAKLAGLAGALIGGLLASSLIGCVYGLVLLSGTFSMAPGELLRTWLGPSFRMASGLGPTLVLVLLACSGMPAWIRLVSGMVVVGAVATVLLLKIGLDHGVVDELSRRFLKGRSTRPVP